MGQLQAPSDGLLIYVWVPEVGNTADTPNSLYTKFPLGITPLTEIWKSPRGLPKGDLVYRQYCLLSAPKHILNKKIIIFYSPGATRLLSV